VFASKSSKIFHLFNLFATCDDETELSVHKPNFQDDFHHGSEIQIGNTVFSLWKAEAGSDITFQLQCHEFSHVHVMQHRTSLSCVLCDLLHE
jgi:hypothetical protein